MTKKYNVGLFIFRRDLRLEDNIGLNAALEACQHVIPIFVFDPRQVNTKKNTYFTAQGFKCMLESLLDLDTQLKNKGSKLYCFEGQADKVIEELLSSTSIDSLFFNKDYTPFSKKRDQAIQKLCQEAQIDCYTFHDALLCGDPEGIKTGGGTPYKVFTPFYNKCRKQGYIKPEITRRKNFYTKNIQGSQKLSEFLNFLQNTKVESDLQGGTAVAKHIVSKPQAFALYAEERDIPCKRATTYLSRFNKFGCVSPRVIAQNFRETLGAKAEPIIRQLYWRDFYTYIAYHFPYVFGSTFQEQYSGIHWSTSKKNFSIWCAGKTGFPIVDAGMRELNATGYMHNRVRLLAASFLVKDLHISWKWGEQYFAQKLVDYDPAVNNGNWQWVAGTGADAAPYFRIFNPWTQQKKYDPECLYIKKWVPELKDIDASIIHAYYKNKVEISGYPKPMVNHDEERDITKAMYKK